MGTWAYAQDLQPESFACGYCGKIVGSAKGFYTSDAPQMRVYICPHCSRPTYFGDGTQVPGVAPGVDVNHLPIEINSLYQEARNCVAVNAYTASVLTCRKLLMNIAVAQGAAEGKNFVHYVEYLAAQGYVPPNDKAWVDHIRKKGNEANHEIILMSKADAEELISFSEMLLKFIYEFPNRVPT